MKRPLLAIVFVLFSCASTQKPADPPVRAEPVRAAPTTRPTPPEPPAFVDVGMGDASIRAAVARTSGARGLGLMGRASLAAGEGMIFLYPSPSDHSFWMKGCLISLDVLYVADDGTVLGMRTLPPPAPNATGEEMPRYLSPTPCRIVFEVAGGGAASRGVKSGSKLRLPDLTALFEASDP